MRYLLLIVFAMAWPMHGLAAEPPKFRCTKAEVKQQQVIPDYVDRLIKACAEKQGKPTEEREAVDVMKLLATTHFLQYGEHYKSPDKVINYLELIKKWGIYLGGDQECRLAKLLDPQKNKYIPEKERSNYQRAYEKQAKAFDCGAANPSETDAISPSVSNAIPREEKTYYPETHEAVTRTLEALSQRISKLENRYVDDQSLPYLKLLLFLLVFLSVIVSVIVWWMVTAPPHFIRRLVRERQSTADQRSERDKGIPQFLQAFPPIKIQIELDKLDVQLRQPQIEDTIAALLEELKPMRLSIEKLVARNEEKSRQDLNELKEAGKNTPSIQTVQREEVSREDTRLMLLNELLAAISVSQVEELANAYGFQVSSGKLDQGDRAYILRSVSEVVPGTHLFAIIYGDQGNDGYLVPLAAKGQLLTIPASWFYDLQETRRSYVNRIIRPACVEFSDKNRQWFSLSSKGEMK